MIDLVTQLGAVQRQVGRRTIVAGAMNSVTISQIYDAEPADVWDACTTAERIARWFLPVSGELTLGGRFALEGNAGGTIERCDPPRSFAATWEFGSQLSWIEVRVLPESDGRTRFELEHLVPSDEHWEQFGPGAVGVGWEGGLLGLATYLGSGETVDPAESAAWAASEAGRQFMAESSERWGAASIAGGTAPEVAQARAGRTTGFYTGVPPT
jgi:uncharacterized protein YndB with AHSA1/START domain